MSRAACERCFVLAVVLTEAKEEAAVVAAARGPYIPLTPGHWGSASTSHRRSAVVWWAVRRVSALAVQRVRAVACMRRSDTHQHCPAAPAQAAHHGQYCPVADVMRHDRPLGGWTASASAKGK